MLFETYHVSDDNYEAYVILFSSPPDQPSHDCNILLFPVADDFISKK